MIQAMKETPRRGEGGDEMIPPRVRWVVRARCVRPEDERQDRAILGSFATLAEADRYALDQLEKYGPSWGSTAVYREEEVGPRTRRAELAASRRGPAAATSARAVPEAGLVVTPP
jgi:hypothetical protein